MFQNSQYEFGGVVCPLGIEGNLQVRALLSDECDHYYCSRVSVHYFRDDPNDKLMVKECDFFLCLNHMEIAG